MVSENYPGFQFLNADENSNDAIQNNGRVCADDYVFVYTLLLHYACVQRSDEKMQSICKNMPAEHQPVIAKVLGSLLTKSKEITRTSIQEVVEEAGMCIAIRNLWERFQYFLVQELCVFP